MAAARPTTHPSPSDDELARLLHETAPERIDTEYGQRLWRAVMLSPTLETCRSLMQGDKVPVSRLDPLWARRFRRK